MDDEATTAGTAIRAVVLTHGEARPFADVIEPLSCSLPRVLRPKRYLVPEECKQKVAKKANCRSAILGWQSSSQDVMAASSGAVGRAAGCPGGVALG